MIHIVTGSINSGKTAKLLSLYKEIKTGDGFILPKIYIEGKYAGQQIVRLSTGTCRTFSFKKEYIPVFWNEKYCYDNYSFSKEGLEFACSVINNISDAGISPVFIDEIGPVELQGKGFCSLLSQLLKVDCSMYISVREFLVNSVVDKFKIRDYEIIGV